MRQLFCGVGSGTEENPRKYKPGDCFHLSRASLTSILQSRAVIGTTGGWRDPLRMEEAVGNGDVDMIGLGRPLREEPEFVTKLLEGEGGKAKL